MYPLQIATGDPIEKALWAWKIANKKPRNRIYQVRMTQVVVQILRIVEPVIFDCIEVA